jgi:hypothetical protein
MPRMSDDAEMHLKQNHTGRTWYRMAHESATILRLCYILCRSVLDGGDVAYLEQTHGRHRQRGYSKERCGAPMVITNRWRFLGYYWIWLYIHPVVAAVLFDHTLSIYHDWQ